MNNHLQNLILESKSIISNLKPKLNWEDSRWDVSEWLPHRSSSNIQDKLIFTTKNRVNKELPPWYKLPIKGPLPSPYIDESKALLVYLQNKKALKYMATRNYLIELRNIHIIMNTNKINSIKSLTTKHFNDVVNFLKLIKYKNIHDSCINLKVISESINELNISDCYIDFEIPTKSEHNYHNLKPVINMSDEDEEADIKTPSLEAFRAYAICTNSPINDFEEILLRTIDILFVMGQRGNEVVYLPVNCWIEKPVLKTNGKPVLDMNFKPIIDYGINYYAEKEFESRTHWLSEQDVEIMRTSINRLRILTEKYREIALFQESNTNRLWDLDPDDVLPVSSYLKYVSFAHKDHFVASMKRKGVQHIVNHKSFKEKGKYYKVSDVESVFLSKKKNHNVLWKTINGSMNIILRTSDLLSIRPEGAFKFNGREKNVYHILPSRTTLIEINRALGADNKFPSIFKRRNLTELNGDPIKITSHMFRHWRNTIYDKAGMSNVQQALALGRKSLNQNNTYQHASLKEKTSIQRDFIEFSNQKNKISFLKDSIINNDIQGPLAETFHSLILKDESKANEFLNTHATSVHVTPFGLCTHDYSQSPCQKHLQCWNNCSHLHRTNDPEETKRIKELLHQTKKALKNIEKSNETYGVSKWVVDYNVKISNLEKALKIKVKKGQSLPVSPEGTPKATDVYKKRMKSY